MEQKFDEIQKPRHYNCHPSGVEAIELCEHFAFNLGNALKYLWRSDLKESRVKDLQKALYYLRRERDRVQSEHRFYSGAWVGLAIKVAQHDFDVLGDVLRLLHSSLTGGVMVFSYDIACRLVERVEREVK